jgi:spermidine synthase
MSSLPVPDRQSLTAVRGPAFLPFLLLLFVGSGCSALIYEIVWFQLLEFAIGSSAASIAVLLGTFMGGLCVGSLLFARVIPRSWHPLRVYAALELGIGVLGVLITLGLPRINDLYAGIAHGTASGIGFRALIAVICLMPPTLLMGATLCAIARYIETTPRGVAWLGFFYGGNTVGAVVGCLLAGFWLLPNYSMASASWAAAVLNGSVALISLLISLVSDYSAISEPGIGQVGGNQAHNAVSGRLSAVHNASIYVAIALSGASALGAEVIWTRMLSLLLGATVYTFSIILAVFLVGLGIGSSIGAMLTRSGVNARHALAWCQILLTVGIGWTAYAVSNGVTHWPVNASLATSDFARFQLDLARCAWAILPPTLFWGASFPLALGAIAATFAGDPAKMVGRVYAANTVGAILGALFFSLIAIGAWGSAHGEHFLMALAGVAALAALLPALIPQPGRSESEMLAAFGRAVAAIVGALAVPVVGMFILGQYQLDKLPWQLVAWGRDMPTRYASDASTKEDLGEGVNSSVAVTRYGSNLYFHVAGKVEASTNPEDMRLQLMLGHYPSLFHPDATKEKRILVVGCGAGVTAGSFILYPHKEIVICELEPLVTQMATHFALQNNDVVTKKKDGRYLDPAVRVVYDDARHYVLTTDGKFDIITSDPIHPWVKGAACLYTKEYFEHVKAHLNPGGLVTQWVPLYESSAEVVKSEIKTFFEVFPNGSIWTNSSDGGTGYDVILLGSVDPIVIDSTTLQKRLDSLVIALALKDSRLGTAGEILKTFGGGAKDLEPWTATGQTNHDSDLRLQYLAGRANTLAMATEIQTQILMYRQFPNHLFRVSNEERQMLDAAWFGGP